MKNNKIIKALSKACYLHENQTRKGKDVPYFTHILDVAKILMYETKNENLVVAGILHDTLEDTKYTKKELIKEFGDDVYKLVSFCTELEYNVNTSEEDKKASWKKRKKHSIKALKNGNDEQLLLFLADKLSSLQSIREDLLIGENVWDRFNAPYENIKWYYKSIRDGIKKKTLDTRTFKLFNDLVDKVFNNRI